MNKAELIEALQNEAGILKNEAETVVNIFTNEISNTLGTGERVEIRGLCSFCVKNYKGYTGRNPKPVNMLKLRPKSYRLLNAGKN